MKRTLFTITAALCLLPWQALHADVPERTDMSVLNTEGDREHAYRHRDFAAYMPVDVVAARLKVGNYSLFENPTGIYFQEGEKAVVTLTGTPRRPVSLIIYNFEAAGGLMVQELTPGRNEITPTCSGLAYIHYRDANPATAPAVHLDIEGGKVNGIFTHKDSDAVWEDLLEHAVGGVLDIVGERCQLVFDIPGLREGCPKEGGKMLLLYDRIISLQQNMLGWDQFNRHPGNHIFGRVQWQGYMHADDLGAAFVQSTIPFLCNPAKLQARTWPVAHEFGHINQTRPGMMWAGTAEVTNNLFAAWINYRFSPDHFRLEHEVCPTTSGGEMRGGRFDCYINNALVERQLWQFQGGPDSGIGEVPGEYTGDHFVTVCPLWQLQLYNAVVLGNESFYPRIFRKVRLQDDTALTHGEMRVNFFLNACEAANLDLSEFFVRTGILAPMDRMVEDYEPHMVTITPEMCLAALEKASKYPKPESSVIYYINGNNVEIFRNRRMVQPSPAFVADPAAGKVEIPAGVWQNAVAFEAVDAKGNLLRVALLGLDHEDNVSTTLVCPPGTVSIRAVQWDGTRYELTTK